MGTRGSASAFLLVVAALACACGDQGTPGATLSSPPVTPAASGELRCRLPIPTSAVPGTAGFIAFPGGAYIVDPNSNPTLPGHIDSSYVHNYTYDLKRSRWLPTSWQAVAIDGSAYAYWDGTAIHVVDIDSGRDS